MGMYTSLILFIPGDEDVYGRMKEVNSYIRTNNLEFSMTDVNVKPFPDLFPRFTFCGSYKAFDVEHFLVFLKTKINWESPQNIRLIVSDDEHESLEVYNLGE